MIKRTMMLTAAMLSYAAAGHATLASSYMGTQCQPYTETDAANLTFSSTELSNNSNGMAYVSCPIMRQNVHNTNGTLSAHVVVRSYSGGQIRCDFQSRTDRAISVAYRTATSSSTSVRKLDLDVNGSSSFGTYALFCTLPAGSVLYSYGIEEYDVGGQTTGVPHTVPTTPQTVTSKN